MSGDDGLVHVCAGTHCTDVGQHLLDIGELPVDDPDVEFGFYAAKQLVALGRLPPRLWITAPIEDEVVSSTEPIVLRWAPSGTGVRTAFRRFSIYDCPRRCTGYCDGEVERVDPRDGDVRDRGFASFDLPAHASDARGCTVELEVERAVVTPLRESCIEGVQQRVVRVKVAP